MLYYDEVDCVVRWPILCTGWASLKDGTTVALKEELVVHSHYLTEIMCILFLRGSAVSWTIHWDRQQIMYRYKCKYKVQG